VSTDAHAHTSGTVGFQWIPRSTLSALRASSSYLFYIHRDESCTTNCQERSRILSQKSIASLIRYHTCPPFGSTRADSAVARLDSTVARPPARSTAAHKRVTSRDVGNPTPEGGMYRDAVTRYISIMMVIFQQFFNAHVSNPA